MTNTRRTTQVFTDVLGSGRGHKQTPADLISLERKEFANAFHARGQKVAIGIAVRKLREQRGFTCNQLTLRAFPQEVDGFDTLIAIEDGHAEAITFKSIRALAAALDITVSSLLEIAAAHERK